MRARSFVCALALVAGTTGCAVYWPPSGEGGMAEAMPVTEPTPLMRTGLDEENSRNLRCIRTQVVALENGVAPDYRPAEMRRIWKQWDRAAREHAGGLTVTAYEDIGRLKAAIANLRVDLKKHDVRIDTLSAYMLADHDQGACG